MTAGINPMPARSDGLDPVEGSPDPRDIASKALRGKAGIAGSGRKWAFRKGFRASRRRLSLSAARGRAENSGGGAADAEKDIVIFPDRLRGGQRSF